MHKENDLTESQLIHRAQSLDDKRAFESLLLEYQSSVRSLLFRLCRDYDVADDLAQETFIQAYQKLNSYKPVGKFSAWLHKIAFNCFLQYARKVKRQQSVLDEYSQAATIDFTRYVDVSASELALERAFAFLSVDEAAALTLCYSFGYSHSEAVFILKMPLGTVKSHIKRGKEKLRKLLLSDNLEPDK